jgi:hypothetical protein
MSVHPYNTDPYDGFRSSDEILAAIEEVAGDDILDEESEAYRIWREPTKEESTKVEALAWAMARADDEVLFWGMSKLERGV